MASDRSRAGSRAVDRRRALRIGAAAVAASVAASPIPRLGSLFDPDGLFGPDDPPPAEPTSNAGTDPIETIHAAGVTGEGVRLGVADPTGFDPGRPELSSATTALRGFGDDPVAVSGPTHGTAAAAAVARVAPAADLALARFSRPREFALAVEWFRDRGVDVLLVPVAAHGTASPERGPVARALRDAEAAGTVVVAPTGNAARGHWQRPVAPDSLREGRAIRGLQVRSPSGDDGPTGRLVAWVTHDGPPALDLSLALVRRTDTGDGRNLIALSTDAPTGTGERLVARLDGGDYRLLVRPSGESPEPGTLDTFRLEVTTPTHRLVPTTPTGSVASPASADTVLAVGAADGDGAAPYSGRGPTSDGGTGVDLVAPPRPWSGPGKPGTSAAAARAAGVAALVCDVLGGSEPRRVRELLETTASEAGRAGTDLGTGHGRLEPLRAVRRARARNGS
ncbi:S8 family serine peptidase [Halorarum halobium]|uniref:S8 family serine peptidase n=1 Tax=Halorarum halobium TaxID=3075121 RepID=UPI0028ABC95A|nr:S8 family serine peptidase [Halobaculum sp. XH14]